MTSDERSLYDLLGVPRDADAARISKAWRKRTRKAGPGSPEFTRLNEAAETLLNPDRRAEYDATLPTRPDPEPQAVAARDATAAGPGSGETPDTKAGRTGSTSEATEPASGVAAPAKPRRAWWLGGLAVLTVLTLVAVVLAVLAVNHHQRDKRIDTARTEATQAAKHAVGVILGYSYKSMDADLKRDLNYLTPSFGKQFTTNFKLLTEARGNAKSPVLQTKTIVTVAVDDAAVMDATETKAHVLVFADQTTVHKTGNAAKQKCPCVLKDRIEVSMVKRHGTWLVDDLRTS